MTATDQHAELTAELTELRARVAQLEDQLIQVEDWANRAVASAQERLYWLDRWHIDLNALMARPGAAELRAVLRTVRVVVRWASRIKRKLRPSS